MSETQQIEPRGRFMRMPEVEREVSLSAATINRLHNRGDFPPKRRLSPGCIGWWESEIERWKKQRELIR